MSFSLDIKTLAFLATLVASACGIYYTMQGRIAAVESRVEVLEEDFAEGAVSSGVGFEKVFLRYWESSDNIEKVVLER